MRSELRAVRTGGVPTVVDLTDECAEFVPGEGDGLLHVFVPHATAGVAIMETGSGSEEDLLRQLDQLLPRDDRWRHRHGSPGPRPRPRAAGVRPPHATCRCSRGGSAGHLAADLPGRHERRQPAAARPVLLPRRLRAGRRSRPRFRPSVAHGRMPGMTETDPTSQAAPSGSRPATRRPTSRCPTPTAGRSPSPTTADAG